MVTFAHAKINLGLRIKGMRPDGYHDIETLLVPVPWYDVVEAVRDHAFAFQVFGMGPERMEDNLVVRAHRLFEQVVGTAPVRLFLLKTLPMGAGLGGGSADGAVTLRLLNKVFGNPLTDQQLQNMAATLGSDVAFFLQDQPCLATGRGDQLKTVQFDFSDFHVLIVYPDVSISTAWAYAMFDRWHASLGFSGTAMPIEAALALPVAQWPNVLHNDFEPMVLEHYPQLARLKAALYEAGAVYASLTGSGSAMYGLFADKSPDLSAFPYRTRYYGPLGICYADF